MAFTYVIAETRGKVRLLANDQEQTSHLFEDDEIDTFLALEGNSVWKAAALALETTASNEALVQKKVTTLGGNGISTDGPAVAAALLKAAANLRARSEVLEEDEDEAGLIDYAEFGLEPFGARSRLENEWLRNRV